MQAILGVPAPLPATPERGGVSPFIGPKSAKAKISLKMIITVMGTLWYH